MNNKNSTVADERALLAWVGDYRLYWELENERVKALPEFQEWAATVITEDRNTGEGWIPGWNVDDCARKWIDHNGFDFPAPPIPQPSWPDVKQEIHYESSETEIWSSATISIGEGREIRLYAITIVNSDESIVASMSANIEGFEETLVVNSTEIDDMIAAMFKARQLFTGIELAE